MPILGWPRAGGGIGRRARLRALWGDSPVEVRVLFGALWSSRRARGPVRAPGRRGRRCRPRVDGPWNRPAASQPATAGRPDRCRSARRSARPPGGGEGRPRCLRVSEAPRRGTAPRYKTVRGPRAIGSLPMSPSGAATCRQAPSTPARGVPPALAAARRAPARSPTNRRGPACDRRSRRPAGPRRARPRVRSACEPAQPASASAPRCEDHSSPTSAMISSIAAAAGET